MINKNQTNSKYKDKHKDVYTTWLHALRTEVSRPEDLIVCVVRV